MEIIEASVNHHVVIKEIAEKTWPTTFAGILSPEQIQYMLNMMYSLDSLSRQVNEGHHKFILVSEQEKFIAFASYETNYLGKAITKIHKIYILPQSQGKGLGKELISYIRAKAVAVESISLRLNVHKNNLAQRFYNKMGFHEITREVIDIGEGFVMDDVQMEQVLEY